VNVGLCVLSVVFVVCFVEHADSVTGAVTEVLQKAAWEWFHVSADKVYVWQYNGRCLDSKHFVYLLNDIGKALVCVTLLTSVYLVVIYTYRVAQKNGASLSRCKYSENSTTELHGNW